MDTMNRIFNTVRVLMWAAAGFLLALPALAMRYFPQAGVDWGREDFIVRSVSRIRSSETWRVSPSLHMSPTVPHDCGTSVTVGAASGPPIALDRTFAHRLNAASSR